MTFEEIQKIVEEGSVNTETIVVFVIYCIIMLVKKIISIIGETRGSRIKDKATLGWIKKGKSEKTHTDILLGQYRMWAIICFGCLFLYAISLKLNIKNANIVAHFISKSLHILLSCIYVRYIWKRQRDSIKKNMHTIRSSVSIGVIFLVIFYLSTIERLLDFTEIFFVVSIILWSIYFFKEWEVKYIYDHKYVNVESKEFGLIKNVRVWDIKRYKGWIGLPVYENGELIENCIKIDDIGRTTYHGNEVTVILKNKYLNTYSKEEL